MALLDIRKVGDPVLRTEAREVEEITGKTRQLIDDMVATMYNNNGIGLAAPQVGVLQRIIVVDIGEGNLYKIINPEIIESSGKAMREEGCLSVPEETGMVVRAREVVLTGLNVKGEKLELKASDLLARAFQHEIDHLNGVLFIDKTVDIEDLPPEKNL